MEQQEEQKWHLVRNNNGEWVSSEQTVCLDDLSAMVYRARARQYGLPLTPQTYYEHETWYYKREVEAVEAAIKANKQAVKPRKLKLKLSYTKQPLNETDINDITNMLKPQTNGSFNALNEECRLWQELEKNPPLWWKNLLADEELYVEIRKDNYANVYYYGGNIALIQWTGREVTAETHQKYLGDKNPVKIIIKKGIDSKTGKETEREERIYEYRDCRAKLQTKEGLEEIKRYIRDIYHDIHGENKQGETREERNRNKHLYTSSEKSVQGALKLHFPSRYIDSEFAYHWPHMDKLGKEHKTIRIDLVELKEKTLVFTELKLITDPRLRSNKNEAEIISQMEEYAQFIKKYAEELKDYYAKLLRIKRRIGLWDGETQIEHVALKPVLLVVNTYTGELSEGRRKRKGAIENLKSTMFETTVVDYPDLCK